MGANRVTAYRHILVLSLLLTLSLSANLYHYWIARNAGARLQRVTYTRHGYRVNPGERARPLTVKSTDGLQQLISMDGSELPTVLYVFTPPCEWCERNLPNVAALAEGAAGRYRLIGLSLDRNKLNDYLAARSLTFPVFMEPDHVSDRFLRSCGNRVGGCLH